MRLPLLLGSATAALVLPACDSHPNMRTTEFGDSADVRIATAPGADVPLDRVIVEVASLGGGDTGPESFFDVGHAIAADTRGRLHVLDRGNYRVLVFDSAGRFLSEYGKRGGGPGELERPEALIIDSAGIAQVFDFGKRGYVRYAPTGEALDVTPVEHYFGGDITAYRGRVMHTRATSSGGSSALQLYSYAPGSEPRIIASRELPGGRTVRFAGCPLTIRGLRPFLSPDIHWANDDDILIVHRTDEYRIEVYEGDRLSLIIKRPIGALAISAQLAELAAQAEYGIDGFVMTYPEGRCEVPPAEMVAQRGHAETVSPIVSLAVAPDRRIWVRRRTAQGGEVIDVFDRSGEYEGTLPEGTPFPDTFLSETRFATVERDSLGVEIIVIYDVAVE
jgi:hypothetical protein